MPKDEEFTIEKPTDEEFAIEKPQTAFQKTAQKRLGGVKAQQIIAQAGEDEEALYRKAAVATAEMLPFALAAPFTGGLSLGAGAAVSGGLALAGGVGREMIEAGHKEQTWQGVAKSLGADVALGVGGELGGRAVGKVLEKGVRIGRTMMEKLIFQSASESTNGLKALKEASEATRKALYTEGANMKVNIGQHMDAAYADLERIPTKGRGAFGEEFASGSPESDRVKDMLRENKKAVARKGRLEKARTKTISRMADSKTAVEDALKIEGPEFLDATTKAHASHIAATQRMEAIEKNLKIVNGQISSHQDFPELIRMKGQAQQFAHKGSGLQEDERRIWERLARGMDKEIRTAAALSDDPVRMTKLYDQSNKLGQVELDRKSLEQIAHNHLKQTAANYLRSHGLQIATMGVMGGVGAKKGGALGAAEGMAAGLVVNAALPKVSTLLLQQMMSNSQAAPLLGRAAKEWAAGSGGKADALFKMALSASGARKTITQAFDFFADQVKARRQSLEGQPAAPPTATTVQ